jgi:hypothetical protein
MVKSRIHGVVSLGATAIAAGISALAMGRDSWALAALYGAIYVAGGVLIIGAFCAKCPCKAHCGHVLPGKLAARFPRRQPGPYRPLDYTLLGIGLAAWVLVPQPWLVSRPGLLVAYWILMGAAGLQIQHFVCRACRNTHCPIRQMQIRQASGQ